MKVQKPKPDCGCNGRPGCTCVDGEMVWHIPENG